MTLAGKVCLVTGGSRGIGRGICMELARDGAHIIVNYSSDEKAAAEAVSEVKRLGTKARMYKADVSSFVQVSKMIEDVYNEFGRIDVLINNAGVAKDTLILRMTEEDWNKVIDINLKGIFNTSKACVKYMVKQKEGKIINLSSIVGIYGNAGQVNYAAAKAGIII